MNQLSWQLLCQSVADLDDILTNQSWRRARCEYPLPVSTPLAIASAVELRAEELDWQDAIRECRRCPLSSGSCKQPISGFYTPRVDLLVVVGTPSLQADQRNQPLAEDEFNYLLKWLTAIGAEKRYLLTNIVKCRPPGERNPFPNEMLRCNYHLKKQLSVFRFRAVLALGGLAARTLAQQQLSLPKLREQQLSWSNLPLVVSYEPATVLQHPEKLRLPVWHDLQRLMPFLPPIQS